MHAWPALEHEAVAVGPVRVRRRVPHQLARRAGRRAARAPSPCPDGRRSPSAPRPSRASRIVSIESCSTSARAIGADNTRGWPCSSPPSSARSSPARRSSTASRSRSSGATGWRSPGRTAPARRRSCARSPARATLQGGELAFEKGTRIALHDQRPPAASGRAAARLRARAAPPTSPRSRRSCASWSRRWRAARTTRRRMRALRRGAGAARARGRLRLARPRRRRRARASASPTRPRPAAPTFSGGELTRASLARALAGAARPAAPRRADEPPRHRVDRVARGDAATIDAAVILVAHDRWFLEAVTTVDARARAAARPCSSPASGTCGGASRRRAALHAAKAGRRGRPRTSRGSSGSSSASAPRTRRRSRRSRSRSRSTGSRAARWRARAVTGRGERSGSSSSSPPRSGRIVARRRGPRPARRRQASCCTDVVVRARARRARRADRPERRREDDAARDDPRPPRPRGQGALGHGVEPAYFSQHEVELDERGSVLDGDDVATGLRRPTRRACSAASSSPAGRRTRSR